ncbi:MAG: type II toxin-antitoxin system RelE/ParE family toxin [Syntrophaceae bacterium]
MPRKKAITFAASAVKDLDDIHAWYADQQISAVGDNLIREIISKIERLGDFPKSGRIVPEFGIANLREIIYSPFRIIYRIDEKRVRVVRV